MSRKLGDVIVAKKAKSKKVGKKAKKSDVTLHEVPATKFPIYLMICPEGEYQTNSWLSLGWEIFKHRLWHLWVHRKWMD